MSGVANANGLIPCLGMTTGEIFNDFAENLMDQYACSQHGD